MERGIDVIMFLTFATLGVLSFTVIFEKIMDIEIKE